MKLYTQAKKYGAKVAAVVSTGLLTAGVAFAQATDPFDAAVDNITDKVETYGAALVGVAAVGVIFMVAMKYVKKLPRAA